ncbi:MAG: carboxylating nicotinate-nucleotide diphosphorylase [Dehalococcoidia bacterium]|nr:carboxylating nicotinate-nucleotide diphosphorylase [Dehalococcoidia bacterium]
MAREALPPLDEAYLAHLARAALDEDAAGRDVTTQALVPPDLTGSATIVAKQAGVVAGLPVAAAVFRAVDAALAFEPQVEDGARVSAGKTLAVVSGRVASILSGERVALNFLQRLSGVATATTRLVDAVGDLPARILDTRKTTPGLRTLEKYAVRAGGGHNHRRDLAEGVLVKDNHWRAARAQGSDACGVIERLREKAPDARLPDGRRGIEVEVTSEEEAREALDAGADMLLLDNMGLDEMRRVVEMSRGRALTEASGGIMLETVRAVAETGVDFISVGAITHSAPALDISLELEAFG